MSNLYIYQNGAKAYHDDNQIIIECKDLKRIIPFERIDHVLIFSNVETKTSTLLALIREGISITWLSKTGKFFGKFLSTEHVDITKQRKQFALSADTNFTVNFARKLVEAKINNQKVILSRTAYW